MSEHAHARLAREIEDRKKAQKQLEERLLFESVIADISSYFISIPSERFDEGIVAAQKKICEAFGFDASGLWQLSPEDSGDLIRTHHYPPDRPMTRPATGFGGKEAFPWGLKMIMDKKVYAVSRLADLPEEAARDKETFRLFGIRSNVTFPLYIGNGPTFGALGFDTARKERDWPEELIKCLQVIAQIFASAMNRKFTERGWRETETRLALAADSADAGLWSWDHKTNRIWVTEKTRSLYGFLPDEEITGESFFNSLHPDDLQRLIHITEKAFRSGTVVQTDYRIVLPDKSVRWILVRAQAFLKPSGEPDRMRGVSLDISQRKQSEMETARLRFELWHLSRALAMNELSSSLAHEINQPLGAILNNASAAKLLIFQAKDKHDEIDEILTDIIKDSRRAGDVIRKIRGLVKKSNVQFEPLSLNPLIEDVVVLLQSRIGMDKVSLLLELSPDITKVMGDYVHLQQVLLNLITNALQAMKERAGKKLSIRSAMSGADTVTVSISDSGTGIDDAWKERLFEPFFTTKKDGLGMGLSICRSIIQEHGGKIWAENDLPDGATFSFSLKAWRGDAA